MEVLYDDVAVPKSPFRVGVTEGCDPTRVRAFGPGLEGGLVNKANRFTVETRYAHPFPNLGPDAVASLSPATCPPLSSSCVDLIPTHPLSRLQTSLLSPLVPSQPAPHPPSPAPPSPLTGPCGADIGVLFCRGAGTGGLGLAIEGPSEAKMSCKDNKDGSCTVEYIPFTPGDYDVNITFGGRPIPGVHQEGAGGLLSGRETGRK